MLIDIFAKLFVKINLTDKRKWFVLYPNLKGKLFKNKQKKVWIEKLGNSESYKKMVEILK